MTDLAKWLLEQIAEDERGPHFCHCGNIHTPEDFCLMKPGCPRRIAAECGAKRRIIEGLRPDLVAASGEVSADEVGSRLMTELKAVAVLRMLALPYASRPGYREEWRL